MFRRSAVQSESESEYEIKVKAGSEKNNLGSTTLHKANAL
jgi:hypothetical protein